MIFEAIIANIQPLIITIFSFIVILSVLVFIHEAGHFYAARMFNVKIDVFSIGFGKSLVQWVDKMGTKWQVSMLPLGGYVKFFGDKDPSSSQSEFGKKEDEQEYHLSDEEKKVCFHYKPLWQKAIIVFAGPFANFALAWVIFTILLLSFGKGEFKAIIGEVNENGAAYVAGLQADDEVLRINNKKIDGWNDMTRWVIMNAGNELIFTVNRKGDIEDISVTPKLQKREDAYGNVMNVGTIGITSDADAYQYTKLNIINAPFVAMKEVFSIITASFSFIKSLVTNSIPLDQLGGPVKIAKVAGQAANSGFDENIDVGIWKRILVSIVSMAQLAALLSVSIGFLNLLPIPALDGGHLMFYFFEFVFRRPLPEQVYRFGFAIGMFFLLSMMILVTYFDISGIVNSLIMRN